MWGSAVTVATQTAVAVADAVIAGTVFAAAVTVTASVAVAIVAPIADVTVIYFAAGSTTTWQWAA